MSNEWMDRGDCQDVDPELFFPNGEGREFVQQIATVKAICYGCPVIQRCLDHAMETRWLSGIWGGTTEEERKSLRRRMRRNAVAA